MKKIFVGILSAFMMISGVAVNKAAQTKAESSSPFGDAPFFEITFNGSWDPEGRNPYYYYEQHAFYSGVLWAISESYFEPQYDFGQIFCSTGFEFLNTDKRETRQVLNKDHLFDRNLGEAEYADVIFPYGIFLDNGKIAFNQYGLHLDSSKIINPNANDGMGSLGFGLDPDIPAIGVSFEFSVVDEDSKMEIQLYDSFYDDEKESDTHEKLYMMLDSSEAESLREENGYQIFDIKFEEEEDLSSDTMNVKQIIFNVFNEQQQAKANNFVLKNIKVFFNSLDDGLEGQWVAPYNEDYGSIVELYDNNFNYSSLPEDEFRPYDSCFMTRGNTFERDMIKSFNAGFFKNSDLVNIAQNPTVAGLLNAVEIAATTDGFKGITVLNENPVFKDGEDLNVDLSFVTYVDYVEIPDTLPIANALVQLGTSKVSRADLPNVLTGYRDDYIITQEDYEGLSSFFNTVLQNDSYDRIFYKMTEINFDFSKLFDALNSLISPPNDNEGKPKEEAVPIQDVFAFLSALKQYISMPEEMDKYEAFINILKLSKDIEDVPNVITGFLGAGLIPQEYATSYQTLMDGLSSSPKDFINAMSTINFDSSKIFKAVYGVINDEENEDRPSSVDAKNFINLIQSTLGILTNLSPKQALNQIVELIKSKPTDVLPLIEVFEEYGMITEETNEKLSYFFSQVGILDYDTNGELFKALEAKNYNLDEVDNVIASLKEQNKMTSEQGAQLKQLVETLADPTTSQETDIFGIIQDYLLTQNKTINDTKATLETDKNNNTITTQEYETAISFIDSVYDNAPALLKQLLANNVTIPLLTDVLTTMISRGNALPRQAQEIKDYLADIINIDTPNNLAKDIILHCGIKLDQYFNIDYTNMNSYITTLVNQGKLSTNKSFLVKEAIDKIVGSIDSRIRNLYAKGYSYSELYSACVAKEAQDPSGGYVEAFRSFEKFMQERENTSFSIPDGNDIKERRWVYGKVTITVSCAETNYYLSNDANFLALSADVMIGYYDDGTSDFYALNDDFEFKAIHYYKLNSKYTRESRESFLPSKIESGTALQFTTSFVSDSSDRDHIYKTGVQLQPINDQDGYLTYDFDDGDFAFATGTSTDNGYDGFWNFELHEFTTYNDNNIFEWRYEGNVFGRFPGKYDIVQYALKLKYQSTDCYLVVNSETGKIVETKSLDNLPNNYKLLTFCVSRYTGYPADYGNDYLIYYWAAEYLHIFDYTDNLSYCSDQEHAYYQKAKKFYDQFFSKINANILLTGEYVYIYNSGDIFEEKEDDFYSDVVKQRWFQWIIVNGDKYTISEYWPYIIIDKDKPTSNIFSFFNVIKDNDSNSNLILTICFSISITSMVFYFLCKRKRNEDVK